ncbi:hypothetical protein C8J57DRAFT_1389549 [Mycena rebaudengoi]|nr:hypothetical protein C8J57DRAFT_1389549 [Mycena rebaudengoi]
MTLTPHRSSAYRLLTNAVSNRLSGSTASHNSARLVRSSSIVLEPLLRENYPNIHFWTESEYQQELQERKRAKGKASMAVAQSQRGSRRLVEDDENVMAWFIENKDGDAITGTRAKQVREKARSLWIHLYDTGHCPQNWSDASSLVRDYYAYELALSFPELLLCEFDYKAHRIATDNYSGWRKAYFEKHGPCVVKVEPKLEEDAATQPPADTVPNQPKRQKSSTRPKPVPRKEKPIKRPTTPAAETIVVTTSSSPSAELSPLSLLAGAASTLADKDLPLFDRSNIYPLPDSPSPIQAAVPSTSTSTAAVTPAPVKSLSKIPAARALAPGTKRPNARPLQRKPVVQEAAPSTETSSATAATTPSADAAKMNDAETTAPASPAAVVVAKPPRESEVSQLSYPAHISCLFQIVNPLASFSSIPAPTTRAEFVQGSNKPAAKQRKTDTAPGPSKVKYLRPNPASITPRNLCLLDYIQNNGKVTKEIFDAHYTNLSQKEKEHYKKQGQEAAGAAQQALAAQRTTAKSGNVPR